MLPAVGSERGVTPTFARDRAHLPALGDLEQLFADTEHGPRASSERCLLDDVYGWFSEGFDAPNLREAQALREQLA